MAGPQSRPFGASPRQLRRIATRGVRRLALVGAAALVLGLLAGCETPAEPVGQPAGASGPQAVDPGWEVREVDTSIDVELPEPFVKLVDLARLRVGMTKAEVLAIFPNPYEIELRRGDEFWQYGFAELIFRDGILRDWFNL